MNAWDNWVPSPRPPNNHDIKLPCRTVRFCPMTLMHILFDVIIITVSNLSVQRVWTDCRHLIESHLNAACGLFTDPDSLKSHISLSLVINVSQANIPSHFYVVDSRQDRPIGFEVWPWPHQHQVVFWSSFFYLKLLNIFCHRILHYLT